MLKAISRMIRPKSRPAPPVRLLPGADSPAFGNILVPQSALDAWPDNPDPLVAAVVDYTTHLTEVGRYNRAEICPAAMMAVQCDTYLAQVLNGGHAQFIGNTRAALKPTIAEILEGLEEMAAPDNLLLVRRLAKWVDDTPDALRQQTGLDGSIDPVLASLDSPFYKLNRKSPLRRSIAAWIAGHPALRAVPDAGMAQALQQVVAANPDLDFRTSVFEMARLQDMIGALPNVTISTAAGALVPPDPVVSVGNGMFREIDGVPRMTILVRTVSGGVWCVPTDDGAAIHERITYDNRHMPKNPYDASLDEIQRYRAPGIGKRMALVTSDQIEQSAATARQLQAGAALHLLLSRLPAPARVDFITTRSAGRSQDRDQTLNAVIILDGADRMVSAVVTERKAFLVSEPEHKPLAEVSAAEIKAHAATYALERLIAPAT